MNWHSNEPLFLFHLGIRYASPDVGSRLNPSDEAWTIEAKIVSWSHLRMSGFLYPQMIASWMTFSGVRCLSHTFARSPLLISRNDLTSSAGVALASVVAPISVVSL